MFSQQRDNMEVAALCFRLWMLRFIVLGAHVQNRDAAFRVVPDRLQAFQLDSVSFHCEGLDGSTQLRGVRNTKGFISACDKRRAALSCTIQRAYRADSGEYWCETVEGERSSGVNIAVTAGSVILESPVLPVMEGNNAALRCRNKTTSYNLTASFYKDGRLVGNSSSGEMVILNISSSDEGLYMCSIPDIGESPESLLAIRALHRETCSSSDRPLYVLLFLRTVFTMLMVALLLLLVGLLHCGKLPRQ